MELLHKAILLALPWVPRSVVRRVAGRYIAGESIDDVIRVVSSLAREGHLSTVDVLGENAASEADAHAAKDEYLRLVERLKDLAFPRQVSVKLTLLGLRIGEGLARGGLLEIADAAQARGVSVCLDMEDSSTTDATIRTFLCLRERHSDVSMAIQAYLHRSVEDLKSLLPLRPTIRICKGIYNESPEIAYRDRRAIQENYLRLLELLLHGGGHPAIATHDVFLIDRALELLKDRGLGPSSHEFQMLLGVGEPLRARILAKKSPLRLYCPYGPDWYAYSLRRLRENPRMAEYVLKNLREWRLARG